MVTPKDQRVKTITGSLRYERKRHGHTQRSLAEEIGANEATVNGWEGASGGAVGLSEAWAIADVYGISLDQLAGRSVERATA